MFKFWQRREKFLILQISPQKTKGLLLSLDKEKKLKPEKLRDDLSLAELQETSVQRLRKYNVICAADSSLATTLSFPVELKRGLDEAERPIASIELENLLSQSVGRLFSQERKEASSRLKVDELDTVLVGSAAQNFKIDGHTVLNPIGFCGRNVEAVMELIFTTRRIFDGLKRFFSNPTNFFFTETARAVLFSLSKVQSLPVNLMIFSPKDALCFILDRAAWGNVVYRDKINWPRESIFEAITRELEVSRAVAADLYRSYLKHEMSDNFKRAFGKIIKPPTDLLLRLIKKSKFRGNVYFYSLIPLPLSLPARLDRIVLEELPLSRFMDKTGFKLDLSGWPLPEKEIFLRLAPFFEFYYQKSETEVNKKLHRCIHWLIQ